MLEGFRACYPTGCFISELITIHNGKYVVRVLVRVDGETLATGLAAADTVELAEDQARKRSLAIIPLNSSISPPQTTSSSETKTAVKLSPTKSTSNSLPQINNYINTSSLEAKIEELPKVLSKLESNEVINPPIVSSELEDLEIPKPLENEVINSPTVSSEVEDLEISTTLEKDELPPIESSISYENVDYSTQNLSKFDDNWLNSDYGTKQKEENTDEETTEIPIESKNDIEIETEITTLEAVDYDLELTQSIDTKNSIESEEQVTLNAPLDLSDDNAKIDILLDTLNWTKEKERDFLEQNYNQKTRSFLTTEQLLDFHQYLELMARATQEIKHQNWKVKQQKDYLQYNHNKESIEQLNIDELQSFLNYLEVFQKTTNEIKRLSWNANKGKSYLKKNYGEEGRTRLSLEKLQDFLQNLEALETPE